MSHPIDDQQQARQYLLYLLARKEYSAYTLNKKLAQRDCPPAIAASLLEEFAQREWQSDLRYAQTVLRAKSHAGYGPKFIQQKLSQERVNLDVEDLAQQLEIDWLFNLSELILRKYKGRAAKDYREQQKRFRFLFSRGFDTDLITQALKKQNDY